MLTPQEIKAYKKLLKSLTDKKLFLLNEQSLAYTVDKKFALKKQLEDLEKEIQNINAVIPVSENAGVIVKGHTQQLKTKLLFIEATPRGKDPTESTKEFRAISEAVNGNWDILPALGATIKDVVKAMKSGPEIVHFSGHGEEEGLYLSTDKNDKQLVTNDVLLDLFQLNKQKPKMVVFTSCNSAKLAKDLSKLGIYVIGMNGEFRSAVAADFVSLLYLDYCSEYDAELAFKRAMLIVKANFKVFKDIPVLWKDGACFLPLRQ
jgi:hypothetical protein